MRGFRFLKITALLLLISSCSFAGVNNIEELDGSPSVYPWKIKVSNGSLTDNGDGTATLTTGGGSGSPGAPVNSVQFNSASSFAGDLSFIYDSSANRLSISRDAGQFGEAIRISSDTGAMLASISHDGSAAFQTLQLRASPLSATEGGTGLRSGTSGGVTYFNSSNTIASSNLLTAHAVVLGGGSGTAPLTITADTATTHFLASTASDPAFRALTSQDIVGTLSVAQGGTGITSGTANALAYFQTAGLMGALTADTTAGHVLVSTTTLPNFRQLVSGDISGTFSVAQGGTGITSGTSGAIPYFTTTGLMASTSLFAANAVVIGGGAGTAPLTITADSTARHALMSTSTAPAFSQIITSDIAGGVFGANFGGTGQSTSVKGDLLIGNGGAWGRLAVGANGTVLSADSSQTLGVKWIAEPTAISIGGSNTQFQYNNNGNLGGTSLITTDGIRLAVGPGTSTSVSVDVAGNFRTVPITLTDAANISLDASRSNFYIVTLGGNRTLSNPTNGVPGLGFTLMVSQDATGSRKLGFGTGYKFGTDVPSYDSSTTAGTKDYIKMRFSTANSCDVVGVSKGFR